MGKKGGGSAAKAKVKASPTPLPEPEAEGQSWFDKLSPADQEMELKKKEKREQAAVTAKRKEETDRWYREQREKETKKEDQKASREKKQDDKAFKQDKERALTEGVLEAVEYDDGLWYVEVSKGTWKHVDCGYWCEHCEASLSESTLGAHINGERHRKKLSWAGPEAAPPTPPRASAGVSSAAMPSRELEIWQELGADGYIHCLACNKCCDGTHEHTAAHDNRLKTWLQCNARQSSPQAYDEPEQPWLAWVTCESWGNDRWLKCLMCNKWVQDHEGGSTAGYVGAHGASGVSNQKDHKKKIDNLAAYRSDQNYWGELMAERAKWHPPSSCPSVRKTAAAVDSDGFRAVGSAAAAAKLASRPKPPDPLPEGWFAEWSEEHSRYYFHDGAELSSWDVPVSPAPSARAQSSSKVKILAEDEEEEC